MGRDNAVNIISMNSVRRGICTFSNEQKSSYLGQLIDGAKPDICFLPGDNGMDLGNNIVVEPYTQYLTPNGGPTVLLYNSNRVEMNRPNVSFSTFGQLPGLDVDKLVTPAVSVSTMKPVVSVVKEFHMVSWQSDLFTETPTKAAEKQTLESILLFSQRLALYSGKSIFIGGEIPLPFETVQKIVKAKTIETNEDFLQQANEGLKPMGYLPSMANGSTYMDRRKFKLEVARCSRNATWSEPIVSDCFIASKELQLSQATMMNVETVLGRQVTVEGIKKYAPVQTEIKYENRPPRHHGG